jgi:hypothetical protein
VLLYTMRQSKKNANQPLPMQQARVLRRVLPARPGTHDTKSGPFLLFAAWSALRPKRTLLLLLLLLLLL